MIIITFWIWAEKKRRCTYKIIRVGGGLLGCEISFLASLPTCSALSGLSLSLSAFPCSNTFWRRDGFCISWAAEEEKGREIELSHLASPSHWLSLSPPSRGEEETTVINLHSTSSRSFINQISSHKNKRVPCLVLWLSERTMICHLWLVDVGNEGGANTPSHTSFLF